jgi:alpha-glucosidase (family GH31 glycosyl hydrolase)
MYYSIAGILSYQMFGITMAGVDICGFNGNTTEELCSRWMQIGAFYPFSRNHNSIDMIPQEPWAFDSLQHIEITRNALNLRYALLPYFYTLVYEAATFGGTIWNALIWEFPADPNCLDIDAQFLVGTGILVTPVLQANQSSVTGYFPADVWYDFYTGAKLGSSTQGSFVELDAPIKKIPIALRGGLIIPTQLPALTTYELRNNAYVLLVSLDENQQASGYVFLDDGITLYTVEQQLYSIVEFSCSSSVLSGKLSTNGYDVSSLILGEVKVFGVDFPVSSIVVNGVTTYHNFRYNPDEQILLISGLILPLASSWEIYWV